jgi:paraquat-inducible protein B
MLRSWRRSCLVLVVLLACAPALPAGAQEALVEEIGRVLHPGEPAPPLPEGTRFLVRFAEDVGGLEVGSMVTVRGLRIGTVREIAVVIDSEAATMDVPVVIDVVPALIQVDGTRPTDPAAVEALAARLVAKGLRATLEKASPLGGTQRVALVFDPEAPPAVLGSGGRYPEIPTAPTLGQKLETALGELVARVAALPLERIADEVLVTVTAVRDLATGPQLTHALAVVERAGNELAALATGPEVRGALASVGQSAQELQTLAAGLDARLTPAIDAILRAAATIETAAGDGATTFAGLERSMGPRSALWGELLQTSRELAATTRSLRLLVEYLERHPDALLRGRPETVP